MKKCPYCAEDIQDAAIVCKHCGRDVRASSSTSITKPAGVALQVLGAVLAFLGLLTALGGGYWAPGLLLMGLGAGLLKVGRRPLSAR